MHQCYTFRHPGGDWFNRPTRVSERGKSFHCAGKSLLEDNPNKDGTNTMSYFFVESGKLPIVGKKVYK